jgi:hypothetical protein
MPEIVISVIPAGGLTGTIGCGAGGVICVTGTTASRQLITAAINAAAERDEPGGTGCVGNLAIPIRM